MHCTGDEPGLIVLAVILVLMIFFGAIVMGGFSSFLLAIAIIMLVFAYVAYMQWRYPGEGE